jgi:hypothetical protein
MPSLTTSEEPANLRTPNRKKGGATIARWKTRQPFKSVQHMMSGLTSPTIGAVYRRHHGLILSGECTDGGSDEVQPFCCGTFSSLERLGWPFYTCSWMLMIEKHTGKLFLGLNLPRSVLQNNWRSDNPHFRRRMLFSWTTEKRHLQTAEACPQLHEPDDLTRKVWKG